MRSEPGAGVFRRRKKPRYTQIAIIRRICRKLRVIYAEFEIFRTLNALFTALCLQNVVHASRPGSKQAQLHANMQ